MSFERIESLMLCKIPTRLHSLPLGAVIYPIRGKHAHTYCVNCKKAVNWCNNGEGEQIIETDKCQGCEGQFPCRGLRWKDMYGEEWISLDDW
jgi:NAD-dependent SIR2 family protein deacetylase